LLRPFHASVEITRAPASLRVDELRQRIEKRIAEEQELVIDRRFFELLPALLPEVRRVKVHPKRGHLDNELNRFRYDVVLETADAPPAGWLGCVEWSSAELSLDSIQARLASDETSAFALIQVPDARVARELAAIDVIAQADGESTVAGLRATLASSNPAGVAAESVRRLASNAGYRVDISLSDRAGCLDAVFWRAARDGELAASVEARVPEGLDLSACTNHPLQATSNDQLVASVRRFLQARLPGHMVPSMFSVLAELPKLPNGKIDVGKLALSESARSDLTYTRPRSASERQLAAIWTEVLGIAQIGVHDNFFTDLGGHSLLATQLVSRIRNMFGTDLPLRAIFERPTIAGLAQMLQGTQPSVNEMTEPPLVALPRSAYGVALSPDGTLST